MAWVRAEGVVLQSSRGPVPNVAEHVAGGPIRGSWWGHPAGPRIYAALESLLASDEVVATRLVGGKVTLVHRRVWPALVRLADLLPTERLASVTSVHTPTGTHRRVEEAFPLWIPDDAREAGARLDLAAALALLPAPLRPPVA